MVLTPGTARPRRGRLLALSAATAAVLAVSGCAGGGQPAPSGTAQLSDATIPSFSWSLQQLPATLDLARAANVLVQQIIAPVTEPLERVAADGSFTPGLATSVSQPDDQTIVYDLPADAVFSDGTPLTAEDVRWSLAHVTDAAAGAQTAGRVTSIASITATGDHQVTVKLNRTDPTARAALAGISYVQEAAFASKQGDALGTSTALPIGTGPYEFKSMSPSEVVLVRNAHYAGTKPKADEIRFVPIADDNGAQLAMRSGDIQQATVTNVKQLDPWKAISGTQILSLPANVTSWLVFDTSKAPFDDVHARKAVAYALDRAGVAAVTYGPAGVVLKAMLPDGLMLPVAGSQSAVDDFVKGLPQYDLDLKKSASELAQSATPNGFDVTIPYTTSSPWAEPTMLNLQENLKGLGITVTPQPLTPEQWAAMVFDHKNPNGMQSMQLIASMTDPNAVLPRIVGKDNAKAPGLNLANWTPEQVEKDRATLIGSLDRAARWDATKSILTQMADDVPYVPLFSPNFVTALAGGYGYTFPLTNASLTDGSWVTGLRAAVK